MIKSFLRSSIIIEEVNRINCEYEKTDENYNRFMSVIEIIKEDPVLNISCIDELEELYNDRNNANVFFFKAGFDLAIKILLKIQSNQSQGVTKG